MKKRLLIPILAGGVLLGTASMIPVFALEGGFELGEVITDTNDSTYEHLRSNNRSEVTATSSSPETVIEEHSSKIDLDQIRSQRDNKKLKQLAEQFGISSEGKEHEVFVNELQQAMILSKAEEYGINTQGKDVDTIMKELKEVALKKSQQEKDSKSDKGIDIDQLRFEAHKEKLNQLAIEFGVSTEGKSEEDLKTELKHVAILAKAQEFGIQTEGKDIETIINELRTLAKEDKN